ncbi:hypothetical protein SDC9_68587 [bioreactor metagenome]|uniref:Uncharacterized protein n=1 Tax=bioreactor metagenome TaxID=1076179 RepID=A0A644Y0V5_9ZZZZ
MAKADAGVEPKRYLAAGGEFAVELQLRNRVDRDPAALVDCKFHLLRGDVVGDIKDALRLVSRFHVRQYLAGGHGVGSEAALADNLEQRDVVVGLHRIAGLVVAVRK